MSTDYSVAMKEHIPALRRYARALVRNPDQADDLVQDCLERALSRINQFQSGTNLRTWMFTIMHNLHCDAMRRTVRRGPHVPIDEWEGKAESPPTQGANMELKEFQRAFRHLPVSDKRVLLLVAMEGFSYEEVSEIEGVAVGTIKSRLFRARQRLRDLMEQPHIMVVPGRAGDRPHIGNQIS